MASVAPAEGLLVAGKYQLLRPLAFGARGEVWVARHRTLGGELAIKFLLPDGADGAGDPLVSMGRFQFEAQIAARLSRRSPHIVRVFDHGEEWGFAYLVMELVEGDSLEAFLRRSERCEVDFVARVVRQIADGLSQAHAEAVIHRDLKPANVLLAGDEGRALCAKILDFGIAKASHTSPIAAATERASCLADRDVILGTPSYMSPEQARGVTPLDHRCDIWALAVIAYELLAGVRPFVGATSTELLDALRRGAFAPIRRHRPDLSVAFEVFFARAFAPRIEDRFASAHALAESFEALPRGANAGATSSATAPSSSREPPGFRSTGTLDGFARVAPEAIAHSRRSRRALVIGLAMIGLAAGAARLLSGSRSAARAKPWSPPTALAVERVPRATAPPTIAGAQATRPAEMSLSVASAALVAPLSAPLSPPPLAPGTSEEVNAAPSLRSTVPPERASGARGGAGRRTRKPPRPPVNKSDVL